LSDVVFEDEEELPLEDDEGEDEEPLRAGEGTLYGRL
jgi:hypothetical protein